MLSSLSILEGVYDQRLLAVKTEYKALKGELQEITSQMHHNFFVIKMDDAAYRLEHYLKQAGRMEEEISLLDQKSVKLQEVLKREQEEVQSLIKASLGRNVLVTVEQK